MSVHAAVVSDLAQIRRSAPDVADSALAALALALASEMDGDSSATSKSMCAKALMEALAALRALAPPVQEADPIDDIATQRKKRRAAAAGDAAAADMSRS